MILSLLIDYGPKPIRELCYLFLAWKGRRECDRIIRRSMR